MADFLRFSRLTAGLLLVGSALPATPVRPAGRQSETPPQENVQIVSGDKATLSNGITLEFLAVAGEVAHKPAWWKPDGTRLPRPPVEEDIVSPSVQSKDKRREYIFVFRLTPGSTV